MLNELELIFPIKRDVTVEDLTEKDREEIRRVLRSKAREAYEAKEAEMTPEIMRVVEQRYLMLPIIDRQWVDHLYVMDHLKTGIGLRGYGQKDPRVEYEKEAYEIFEILKNNIADEAIKGVFRVQIEHGPPPQQMVPGRQFEPIPSGEMVPQPAPNCGQRASAATSRTASRADARHRPPRAAVPHEQRRRIAGKTDAARPTKSRTQRNVPVRQR